MRPSAFPALAVRGRENWQKRYLYRIPYTAGIEIPSVYQGLAFLGSQKSKKSREFVFTASDRFDEEYDRVRSIRTKKYKYIKNYNLEKSHALDLCYRNQMPLMRHLNNLLLQNKLNEFQSLWFREPRYSEELYDLENDPFEIFKKYPQFAR